MKLDARLPLTGRRLWTLGLAALVSCFMLSVGTSEAAAKATPSKSLTQAQKLSKALKACKKQPKRKRAACVKRAKKKYAPHHAVTPPTGPATTPTTPTAPVAPPTAPVAPPAGSGVPPGPTQAWLQQELERDVPHSIGTNLQILNLTILARGTPRPGSGLTEHAGGDGVPSTTWIYPLQYTYDFVYQSLQYVPPCPPSEPFCRFTETFHYRTEAQAQFDEFGQWVIRPPSGGGTQSCKSEPVTIASCNS
jgi:hypothetical protein